MNPRTVTASPGAVFGMLFTTEHKLTRIASGPGTISGSDGYYSPEAMLQLTATPAAGYQFAGWSGSASGTENPLMVTMDSAKTIVANFAASAHECPHREQPLNAIHRFRRRMSGRVVHYACNLLGRPVQAVISLSPPQGGPDTRQVFARWTDGVRQTRAPSSLRQGRFTRCNGRLNTG